MSDRSEEAFSSFGSTEELSQFLHDCVNTISRPDRLKDRNSGNSNTHLITAKKMVQNYYRQRLIDDSTHLPLQLPQKLSTAINTIFTIRHDDIINAIAKEKLMDKGLSIVETFDWKLKWVLGSSKLASIREPLGQVELNCLRLGDNSTVTRELVQFECDLETINKVIRTLKSVKSELDGV